MKKSLFWKNLKKISNKCPKWRFLFVLEVKGTKKEEEISSCFSDGNSRECTWGY